MAIRYAADTLRSKVFIYSIFQTDIPGDESEELLPGDDNILYCYPNPFNSSTTIIYNRTLDTDREVIIEIYNLLGELVKSLPIKKIKERSLQIIWDATDNSGNKVSSGIYFACIMEQHLITSIKVVYLR